jgi:hypothetical protein
MGVHRRHPAAARGPKDLVGWSMVASRRGGRRTRVRRGVNATGCLRFLDPMAARAREKSVASP